MWRFALAMCIAIVGKLHSPCVIHSYGYLQLWESNYRHLSYTLVESCNCGNCGESCNPLGSLAILERLVIMRRWAIVGRLAIVRSLATIGNAELAI